MELRARAPGARSSDITQPGHGLPRRHTASLFPKPPPLLDRHTAPPPPVAAGESRTRPSPPPEAHHAHAFVQSSTSRRRIVLSSRRGEVRGAGRASWPGPRPPPTPASLMDATKLLVMADNAAAAGLMAGEIWLVHATPRKKGKRGGKGGKKGRKRRKDEKKNAGLSESKTSDTRRGLGGQKGMLRRQCFSQPVVRVAARDPAQIAGLRHPGAGGSTTSSSTTNGRLRGG